MVARGFPVVLLLLVWTVGTYVDCQELNATNVTTNEVQVAWTRTLLWEDVEEFTVHFAAEESADCIETIPCSSPTCLFSSLDTCGSVSPCTLTTTAITGDNYTAPSLSLTTGPEPITNLTIQVEDGDEYVYISWANPSNDSSRCYNFTTVTLFINHHWSTTYHGIDEESMNKSLCGEYFGFVEVWTVGGDGKSMTVLQDFVYDAAVFDSFTCKLIGCTDLELTWSYTPQCINKIGFLGVYANGHTHRVAAYVTELNITGLDLGTSYRTCTTAYTESGKELGSRCQHCRTAYLVVENLTAVALNSTSLKITWDPPVCSVGNEPLFVYYEVYVHLVEKYSYSTNETNSVETDLLPFHEYEVTVRPNHYAGARINTTAHTLLPTPDLWIEVTQDYVHAEWYYDTDAYPDYTIYYKVMWGNDLQHIEETQKMNFIINFNSTEEVVQVCLAAVPEGREDSTSLADCKKVTTEADNTPKSLDWVWITLGVLAGVVLVALGVFVYRRRIRNTTKL